MANEKRIIPLKKRIIYAGDLWQKTFICDEVAEVRKFIEQAPTVDAVEVVRCKDCKYYKQNKYSTEKNMLCQVWCDWLATEPDDFCSYGERREGE